MTEDRSSILTSSGTNVVVRTQEANTVTETEADTVRFAEMSGDFNPAHICSDFAEKTLSGGRIGYGMLVAGLTSAAVAELPGREECARL